MFDFDFGTLFNLPDAGGGGGFFSGLGDVASKIGGGVADFASGFGDVASGVAGAGKDLLSGFGGAAKSILPLAQLGATGMGIASGIQGAEQASDQNKILRRAQQTQERAAAPLAAFGEDALRRASGGKVSPAIQAGIDQWAQGAKQKARDYLARSGQGDSSTLAEWESWIDQQAESMKSSAIGDEERTGVAALTGAAGTGAQIAAGAKDEQGSLENLIAQANQQLTRLAGTS